MCNTLIETGDGAGTSSFTTVGILMKAVSHTKLLFTSDILLALSEMPLNLEQVYGTGR